MQLIHDGSRFIARSSFDERAIPKSAGFRWDGASRVWFTTEATVAARLREYADEATKAKLNGTEPGEAPKAAPMRLGRDTDGAFRFWCSIDERHIAKAAGFRFDAVKCRWITKDVATARKLAKYADAATVAAFADHEREAAAALEASTATSAEVELPCPEGLAYLPYQKAGIAYGAGKSGVLIADEMGLGKTVQAIGIANVDLAGMASDAPYRWLIMCPASLRINWQREVEKWLVRKLPVHIIEGGKESPVWAKVRDKGGVVVCNYDVAAKHRPAIDTVTWDNLTLDEAHLLKNAKAKRTKAVLGGRA